MASVFRVRQIMAGILRIPVDRVSVQDSFASLTGAGSADADACDLDDNFLDLMALEMAIKQEFQLEISEEDNETIFKPSTKVQQIADYIDHYKRS